MSDELVTRYAVLITPLADKRVPASVKVQKRDVILVAIVKNPHHAQTIADSYPQGKSRIDVTEMTMPRSAWFAIEHTLAEKLYPDA